MRGMSDEVSGPDVQRFDSDGTWRKPEGAVRVELALKGGDAGHPTPAEVVASSGHTVSAGAGGGGSVFAGCGGGGAVGPVIAQGGAGVYSGRGGEGAGSTAPGGNSSAAGGGGGQIGVVAGGQSRWQYMPPAEGELVRAVWTGADIPGEMRVQVGRGGYAVITTYREEATP